MNNYTTEISSLVSALKNKDREIQEIQENMSGWKKETLSKLAEKFEVELNKEVDRRMQEYKLDSASTQIQLDKIRKEMELLTKDYRQTTVSLKRSVIVVGLAAAKCTVTNIAMSVAVPWHLSTLILLQPIFFRFSKAK